MPIKIALLEDAPSFTKYIELAIQQALDMALVATAANVQSAIATFVPAACDVYLIDIQLPDGSGIDAIKVLKPQLPSAKFIICTSFDDDATVFEALKAGANGYMVKTDEHLDIIKAINECMQGDAPMSSGIAAKVIQYFHNLGQQKTTTITLNELTQQENNVLLQLSKGYLYKEIADNFNISIDTIKKHCGNIYRKLDVCNRTEAINLLHNR